eukprot:57401-Prorocentrum_minimum.AAC.1
MNARTRGNTTKQKRRASQEKLHVPAPPRISMCRNWYDSRLTSSSPWIRGGSCYAFAAAGRGELVNSVCNVLVPWTNPSGGEG